MAILANLLGVTPSLPANNVAELIALCKKDPGKYSFASSGPGTSLHLSGELFKTMAGVDIIHVPYKGAGPVYTDLMAGTVNMMFANMPSMLPQVRGGKLKGLGVTSAQRSKAAPEIPAIAETVPGYVATSWYGIGAPAGTPEPILARLEAAIAEALKSPDIQKRWSRRSRPRPAAARPCRVRPVPGRRPQALGARRQGLGREARLIPHPE